MQRYWSSCAYFGNFGYRLRWSDRLRNG